MPFCQATCRGIEGEDGEALYDCYEEMSRAAVRNHIEPPKAKALWKMKAAEDRREDVYDPDRKDNILRRNKTRLELCEEHVKDPIVALDKALKNVENSYWRVLLALEPCGGSDRQWPVWSSFKICGRSRSGRAFGPSWIRWIVFVYAQHPCKGLCQGSTGRMASSFSS